MQTCTRTRTGADVDSADLEPQPHMSNGLAPHYSPFSVRQVNPTFLLSSSVAVTDGGGSARLEHGHSRCLHATIRPMARFLFRLRVAVWRREAGEVRRWATQPARQRRPLFEGRRIYSVRVQAVNTMTRQYIANFSEPYSAIRPIEVLNYLPVDRSIPLYTPEVNSSTSARTDTAHSHLEL